MSREEERFLEIIEDLRAENSALLEIIFKSQGLIDEKVIVPEGSGAHIGKEPWYIKKKKLESSFRIVKNKEEETKDAG